ncbi:MAG: aminoacyl-tRNA hydrolase, partial [Eubacteriales bacterium]|nr:aminoacyl-tRNA hydrolase [Eubacteriales bacterium]
MYIIAGLGNPGKKYENTKHNIGFITLDFLAEKHSININKIKHKALVGEGTISGQKLLLVKPQTYMNLSGSSIKEVMDYYKADLDKLIGIYDDVDIPIGSLRIRKKGSAGTHNGMKSIIYD